MPHPEVLELLLEEDFLRRFFLLLRFRLLLELLLELLCFAPQQRSLH